MARAYKALWALASATTMAHASSLPIAAGPSTLPSTRASATAAQRWFNSRARANGLTGTRFAKRSSVTEVAVGVATTFVAVRRSRVVWASPTRNLETSAPALGLGDSAGGIAMASAGPERVEPLETPVVSVDWLHQHINDPNLKVIDASWYMPVENRNGFQEYQERRIQGAIFFDLDGIKDTTSELPHMLPTEAAFAAGVSALGISNEDTLIVYDGKGIFSAARVWWMFRVFGHEKVWVLEGGLPKWRARNYPLESSVPSDVLAKIEKASSVVNKIYHHEKVEPSTFKAKLQPHLVRVMDQVEHNVVEKKYQLVDARSRGRFNGTDPEPRKGIESGHIPGSNNVPFPDVLSSEGTLLQPEELADKFTGAGVDLRSPIVATCGTGVTACILALALHRVGKKDVPVYDGSWTEWYLKHPHT